MWLELDLNSPLRREVASSADFCLQRNGRSGAALTERKSSVADNQSPVEQRRRSQVVVEFTRIRLYGVSRDERRELESVHREKQNEIESTTVQPNLSPGSELHISAHDLRSESRITRSRGTDRLDS